MRELAMCPGGDWSGEIDGPAQIVRMSAEGIGDAYRIIDVHGTIVHDCDPATRSI